MRNKCGMNNAVRPVPGVDGKNVMSQERQTGLLLWREGDIFAPEHKMLHSITERLRLEETFRGHLVQPQAEPRGAGCPGT